MNFIQPTMVAVLLRSVSSSPTNLVRLCPSFARNRRDREVPISANILFIAKQTNGPKKPKDRFVVQEPGRQGRNPPLRAAVERFDPPNCETT